MALGKFIREGRLHEEDEDGKNPRQKRRQELALDPSGELDVVLLELLGQRAVDAGGAEELLAGRLWGYELTSDLPVGDDDLLDLVLLQQALELAIGQGGHRLAPGP